MRNAKAVALFLAVVLASLFTLSVARAQDPVKVSPEVYKVVFENDRVRVLEATLAPGAKTAPHSHPDHLAYVLASGKLKMSGPGGKSADMEPKVGEVLWIPAETHWAENTGDTEARLVIVELKEPAPKKKAAKKPAASETK